jgi:hypothetical protein
MNQTDLSSFNQELKQGTFTVVISRKKKMQEKKKEKGRLVQSKQQERANYNDIDHDYDNVLPKDNFLIDRW